ncbi:hypothetical protein JTB14_038029 [Gonioctena quinquepunctata]|nr:hypothetical protein JTB14_038029 [Gonioctena quinquepunctata]
MAFVCPPKEESEGKVRLINDIRKVLDEVEKKFSVSARPVCVPCCLPVPVCDLPPCYPCAPPPCHPCAPPPCYPCAPPPCHPCAPKCGGWNRNNGDALREQMTYAQIKPPEVMVCYKVCQKNGKKAEEVGYQQQDMYRLKQSKSRELRASILYTGCDCEKRDGLQDDCLRTDCRGSPECFTNPPTCGPSEFCNGKHLAKKSPTKKGKDDGGAVRNDEGLNFSNTKYKCFPAVVSDPVCCCCTQK